uniref:VPS53Bf n=1 Tax=Volvox carteri f. nagariensis TaxID=3068 RepID=D9CIV8_VOLCA|nr:VPS53Bf [Volvox carteri f. nagariensis]
MASTHPRGAQISGGAMASSPSGKTSMERSTSLEQQAKLQSQPTTLKMPSRKRADLFDSEDFDPTKLINQLYPDEASLTDLDKFVTVLKNQIEELFTKIRDIQRKSEESEVTVQEVCRDIKKLDYAKKHLTNSITALRRLAMLTAAVTDLEALCDRRDQYRKCANLIEAAHKLMECFQQYEAIPKVRSIALRLAAVEARLQYAVLNDFKILIGGPANDGLKMPPENLERLATACLVVDVLGKEVQDQVMDWLCSREMSIYQSAFGGAVGMMVGATAAADDRGAAVAAAHATRLDKFEQRFGWFRERLKEKREVWGVFPQHWRVPQMLCLTFCKITKAHLKRILSDEEALAGLRSDVGPLLKAVVATNRFERDMAALFGGGGGRQGAGGGADDGDDDSDPGGGGGADSMSASEARRRLEKFRARMKAEQQAARAAKDQQQAGTAVARISEAFEGVLVQYYVDQEERELLEALDGAVREEVERRWLPDEEEGVVTGRGTRVLQSANKIFFRIRASLTRCSKNLFRRVLSGYAAELMRRLPKTAAGGTSANPAVVGGSTHWYVRLSEEDERVVCCLLATAEFCRDTTEGLGGALAKDVKPHFADRVDFGEVSPKLLGQFYSWYTLALAHSFVVLLDCAPPLGAGLEAANLSFMCDKVARMFVPRLREAIFRLRRVADGGMMQLAIDMDAAFTTYVEREMGHVVALVKVLQSRPEQLVDNYLLLMPPAAQSLMEFQRLCDLKALNRKQLSDLMGCYQLKAGQLGGRAGGGEAGGGTSTATGGGTGGAAGPSVGGEGASQEPVDARPSQSVLHLGQDWG